MTRIEVLVALLCVVLVCAIAVPVGQAQRRSVYTVDCQANLGQIAQTAAKYGAVYDDWIVGSPNTSGAYLLNASIAYGPAVQVWEFMGVLQFCWDGVSPPPPGNVQAVIDRFNMLRGDGVFRCPQNSFQATHFTGPNAGTGPMISYNTSRMQMWYKELPNGIPGLTVPSSSSDEALPVGRAPRVSTMGQPQRKVFCADGARYSTSTFAPDYDLSVRATSGGAFSDSPPYDSFSRSWDRSWANGNSTGIDARIYGFRHSIGNPPPGAPGNAYRLNVAFYDGHVETQGDLDASNPQQWLPMNTVLRTVNCWADTQAYFSLPRHVVIGP